jgi:hypothetical protein
MAFELALEAAKEVGAYRLAVLLLNAKPLGVKGLVPSQLSLVGAIVSLGEAADERIAKGDAVGDNAKGLIIVENLRGGGVVLIRERGKKK